jgi:hypothetical protein
MKPLGEPRRPDPSQSARPRRRQAPWCEAPKTRSTHIVVAAAWSAVRHAAGGRSLEDRRTSRTDKSSSEAIRLSATGIWITERDIDSDDVGTRSSEQQITYRWRREGRLEGAVVVECDRDPAFAVGVNAKNAHAHRSTSGSVAGAAGSMKMFRAVVRARS